MATTSQSVFNNGNNNKSNSNSFDQINKFTKVNATVNLVADSVDRGKVNKRINDQAGESDISGSQVLRENNSELSINNTRHE
ncbi:hypothetical protein C0J52_07527 [Blattella germanica]|nr:hypothetical protein C0J52_07527 [Blattella germanica]